MIFTLIVAAVACLAAWTIWGNTALEVNTYVITSDRIPQSFSGFRIAQVSDLHNAEFGEDNARLIAMLSREAPDIIVITGDFIDSRNTDIGVALHFAQEAMKIAPCYYVTGNHEARVSAYVDLKAGLEAAGVVVLENESIRIGRAGEYITILGVDDPNFRRNDLPGGAAERVSAVLTEISREDDGYTVLLSHRPELFGTYVDSKIDLVFSGHAHGGQFRLPFVGGLVAPNQGLFPAYDAGLFAEENTAMIVSRGVGNSIIPVRFNNRPEIIVVELESKK